MEGNKNKKFELSETYKKGIIERNIATQEEIEAKTELANKGDLKAQVELYTMTCDYKRILSDEMQNEYKKVIQRIKENSEKTFKKEIEQEELEIYNDEIQREYYNQKYDGKYKNVVRQIREEVKEKVNQKVDEKFHEEEGKREKIKELGEIINDRQPMNELYSQFSDQQQLFSIITRTQIHVSHIIFQEDYRNKEKNYFPKFTDKFEMPYSSLDTYLRYDKLSRETEEKFNLLANLNLPENEYVPSSQDINFRLTIIRDIHGDFDKNGNIDIKQMTIDQNAVGRDKPLQEIIEQSVVFDFEKEKAYVSGSIKKGNEENTYQYTVDIKDIDLRIQRFQSIKKENEQVMDNEDTSLVDKFLAGRKIKEAQQELSRLTSALFGEKEQADKAVEH